VLSYFYDFIGAWVLKEWSMKYEKFSEFEDVKAETIKEMKDLGFFYYDLVLIFNVYLRNGLSFPVKHFALHS